jgi:hypothetical protein
LSYVTGVLHLSVWAGMQAAGRNMRQAIAALRIFMICTCL